MINFTELLDIASRLAGQTDSREIAAEGMANILNYCVESADWDNAVRHSVQRVNTNEGMRIARIVDARRTDRTAGMSLITIDTADGSLSYGVNFGDYNSTTPLTMIHPLSASDWRFALVAFKAFDEELSARKESDVADATEDRHPFALLREIMVSEGMDGSPLMSAMARLAGEQMTEDSGEKSCTLCTARIPRDCLCGKCHRCEHPHN